VTDSRTLAFTQRGAENRSESVDADSGWYLYGIIRPIDQGEARALLGSSTQHEGVEPGYAIDDDESVQTLRWGDLAAIVRRVSLDDFAPEAFEARLRDPAWLEAMVRSHNEVIASIHEEQAILPSKFGCVYQSAEDVTAALEQAHDALTAQLARVDQCDEWAVHLYADRRAVEKHLEAKHPSVQRLQQEASTAPPGRAFFLRRKLTDEIDKVTRQATSDAAEALYEELGRWAVAEERSSVARVAPDSSGEVEILRAAFLVHRESQDAFLQNVRTWNELQEGLRCTHSGPWPPYSFAVLADEES
jgi:Gas vesicle synthesis protein GvpL/GvpF